MDRNTIIGIVLIAGIVLTWMAFFGPDETKKDNPIPNNPTEQITISDQTSPIESPTPETAGFNPETFRPVDMTDSAYESLSDSSRNVIVDAAYEEKYGVFAPLAKGEDKVIHISTDKLDFDIHSKGALVRPLIIKEFKTYDSLPLPLITSQETNYLSLQFLHRNKRNDLLGTQTKDLFFQPVSAKSEITLTGDQTEELVFKAALDASHFVEFVYHLKGNAYDYDLEVRMTGMNDRIQKSAYDLIWMTEIPKTEKAMALQREKTALHYRASGDVESLSTTSDEPITEALNSTAVDWVAFKSQFFSQTLMVKDQSDPFKDLTLTQANPIPPVLDDPDSGEIVRYMGLTAQLSIGGQPQYSKTFTMINHPLEYSLLKDYDRDMSRQIKLGWGPLKYINMYVIIPVFNFLEGTVGNYGLIIFILAVLIKLLLYPLTFKTYISSAKMRVINQTPEIKGLEEKYKDDSTKLQQEKMGIYRKMGVSMLGGCWPMLLQYPFLISLFFLFPNLIELRQQGFLWADDLSTYDSILELGFKIPFYGDHVSLFTLLMTVSIYIYTMINQKMQGTTQSNPVMKYFPYIMPIMFLGFLNNYSAGLSWYYLVSNLISITQAQVSKLFIDEEKLLAQMRDNAKAKGKKGKSRLEKWASKQQAKQQQMQAAKAGGGGGQEEPAKKGNKHTAAKKRRKK